MNQITLSLLLAHPHRKHVPGRIGIAAQMLGLAQGAFNKAVPYTYSRSQFGQPIGTFQGMAFQIAQAAVEIETVRLLTYNAARRKDEGKSFTKEAAMAKYWSSVIAQRVSGQAIEWTGGVGFTRETGLEKYWRDSKIVSITVSPIRQLTYQRHRVQSMKEHPTFNYRRSPNSFRKSTPSIASGIYPRCNDGLNAERNEHIVNDLALSCLLG
jgi:hypothetical protein